MSEEWNPRAQFPTKHRAQKGTARGRIQRCMDCNEVVMDNRGAPTDVYFDGIVFLWFGRTYNYNPMMQYYFDCTKPRSGVFVSKEPIIGSQNVSAPTATEIEEAPTSNGKFCDCMFCGKYCQCACHKDQSSKS